MPEFVIRSMSTSDWNGRDPVVPYHCFLMRPEKRGAAWWSSSMCDAMRFPDQDAAEREWRRLFVGRVLGRQDIAPVGHPVPVWEAFYYQPERRDQVAAF